MRRVASSVGVISLLALGLATSCGSDSVAGDAGQDALSESGPADAPPPDGDQPDASACTRASDDCPAGSFCNFGACTPTQVTLPADAAPHRENVEWWYYTGHLDAGDRRFGFELALFQQDMAFFGGAPGLLGYMCHVAVLDEGAGIHDETNLATIAADVWQSSPVVLQSQSCHLELSGDGHDRVKGLVGGTFQDPTGVVWALDLQLDPQKPVTYHGGDGIVRMGNLGDTSYYYSYTRLAASGTLTGSEGPLDVTGQAWMDHQWGPFDINAFKGWDWWSMQLDDGWEIMLFQFRDWAGNLVHREGTLVDPDGNLRAFRGLDSFELTSLRAWPSPHTDGTYPLDWDVTIPELDWDLHVRTGLDDQEMPNVMQNYWEGAVTVTGTRGDTPVEGVGYVELTGYATDKWDPKL